MVQKSLSNPKASKISDYKQNQKDKWSQGQSQPQNGGRDQNQGCSYFGAKEKHGGNPNKGKGSPQSASTIWICKVARRDVREDFDPTPLMRDMLIKPTGQEIIRDHSKRLGSPGTPFYQDCLPHTGCSASVIAADLV